MAQSPERDVAAGLDRDPAEPLEAPALSTAGLWASALPDSGPVCGPCWVALGWCPIPKDASLMAVAVGGSPP